MQHVHTLHAVLCAALCTLVLQYSRFALSHCDTCMCFYCVTLLCNRKLYTTSNGGVTVRANTHIETISQRNRAPRSAIIVTQLPYMVNKAGLLEKIAAMVNDKKLDGMLHNVLHVAHYIDDMTVHKVCR
jgi:hypothetical protein